MKTYSLLLTLRITAVLLCSIALGYAISQQIYWLMTILILTDIVLMGFLLKFIRRNIKDVQRLVEAIQFYEFNISLKKAEKKGLYPDLRLAIEQALKKFNHKTSQLEAEQNFYDILLNRVDTGLIVLDNNKNIYWINKTALDLLGKPLPYNLNDLLATSEELPSFLDNLTPRETKTIKIKKEKKEYSLAASAVMLNIEGKELKLISLKNIQTALDENENEAWKKLIKVLTHEMMNSMTPIISLSETFSKRHSQTPDDEMIYGAMQTIHRRSKGLVEFVNNYKRLTHIAVPNFTPLKADELLKNIYNLISASGVSFSYEINPVEIIIHADGGQLEQVLINLIKNAWEAALHMNNPIVHIAVSLNEYQRPIITVTDNGSGIPEELLDKIFIPFFSTKQHGSGIGLSICRQIINAHGGTLTATSDIDSGSTFTIKL